MSALDTLVRVANGIATGVQFARDVWRAFRSDEPLPPKHKVTPVRDWPGKPKGDVQ